jgi:hypothetical protein
MKIMMEYVPQSAVAGPLTGTRDRSQSALGSVSKGATISRRKRTAEAAD